MRPLPCQPSLRRNEPMRGCVHLVSAAVVASTLLIAPGILRAQSAEELISSYRGENERRLEGVDNVLVVQSVLGMSSELYMEKAEANGTAVLEARLMRMAGGTVPLQSGASDGAFFGDPSAYLFQHSEEAELRGTEAIDGAETSVIAMENLTGIEFSLPGLPGGEGMQVRSLRFFVDTEAWLIRRMEAYEEAVAPGEPSGAALSVDFGDFRSTDGFVHPFRIVVSISGVGSGISAAELEQARRTLAEMQARLETMPPGQREVVEAIVAEQLQNLLGMTGPASMTAEILVDEVRLNAGAPGA